MESDEDFADEAEEVDVVLVAVGHHYDHQAVVDLREPEAVYQDNKGVEEELVGAGERSLHLRAEIKDAQEIPQEQLYSFPLPQLLLPTDRLTAGIDFYPQQKYFHHHVEHCEANGYAHDAQAVSHLEQPVDSQIPDEDQFMEEGKEGY